MVSRTADTPVITERTLSVSDAIKNTLSTDRQLILPSVNTKEALSVQTETVRLNGQVTMEMTAALVSMANKVADDFAHLKIEMLKLKNIQISDHKRLADGLTGPSISERNKE
jgi:hypothetical protein